jgi:hypothetical protein
MELIDAGCTGVLVCDFHPGMVGTELGLNTLAAASTTDSCPVYSPSRISQPTLLFVGRSYELRAKERMHVVRKEQQWKDGGCERSTVFEDADGVHGMYSWPRYKQAVGAYNGVEDTAKRQRTTRTACRDVILTGQGGGAESEGRGRRVNVVSQEYS